MKIDAKQIINETIAIFKKSGADKLFTDFVKDEDYKRLHPFPLTPTSIWIDPEQFKNEITAWDYTFEQWGKDHAHLPRYGTALVNQNGTLLKNDPINGSLMAWNRDNPTKPLIETDCRVPTALMNIPSLEPLSVFKGYWCRSNILKWDCDAKFLPHIDTVVPSPWIRLWASMNPEIIVRFFNESTGELESVNFEPGRVYVVDTSLVHDAYAVGDNIYQLFLSVLPTAVSLIDLVTDSKRD
jgi:hypothetical protein